ncbi:hypothetical protein ROZALSC1DRAFT_31594, partial [Rozella allomycis CSF55]
MGVQKVCQVKSTCNDDWLFFEKISKALKEKFRARDIFYTVNDFIQLGQRKLDTYTYLSEFRYFYDNVDQYDLHLVNMDLLRLLFSGLSEDLVNDILKDDKRYPLRELKKKTLEELIDIIDEYEGKYRNRISFFRRIITNTDSQSRRDLVY